MASHDPVHASSPTFLLPECRSKSSVWFDISISSSTQESGAAYGCMLRRHESEAESISTLVDNVGPMQYSVTTAQESVAKLYLHNGSFEVDDVTCLQQLPHFCHLNQGCHSGRAIH
jgi:hypothetical protein